MDRRQFLAGLGVSLGAASIGCGDNLAPPERPAGNGPPPAEAGACTLATDLSAKQLLAEIETVVVLCLENRSFDNVLGALRLVEGRTDIDGLTGAETNLDRDGNPVGVHRLDDFTESDPPHNWGASHRQWNNGANDGFVWAHAGAYQADVMGYQVREQRPVTYALADAGAVCNRWFASCLGPTWPNRAFLHAATSEGMQGNFPMLGLSPTIWERLTAAGLTGTNYYHDIPWVLGGFGQTSNVAPIEQFFHDAQTGSLPPFALIDPAFFGGGANDDHATHDIRLGQALLASVVAALGESPQWNRCLFVVTYDEHGGFFDHVPPPALGPDAEPEADFASLGFRVPSIVIGPHIRRRCAVDTVLEHSSLISTVCRRFGLPPLTGRDNAAADLSSCIDPRRFRDPLPPPRLPVIDIPERHLAARQAAGTDTHPELTAALDALPVPAGIDRRADTDAIVRRVLRYGEDLGVVRMT
jgi:phospholipase C